MKVFHMQKVGLGHNLRVAQFLSFLSVLWTIQADIISQSAPLSIKINDFHGRLAWWIYLLANYKLDVEYIRGSGNVAVYYLSRVVPEETLNPLCFDFNEGEPIWAL